MKALLLENGQIQDIPKNLINYLEKNKIEWEHYHMYGRFWPENRVETFKFFSELPEGQVIMFQSVFMDFQQLELMIELLTLLNHKKFVIKIFNYYLPNELVKFWDEKESSITPKELDEVLVRNGLTDAQVTKAFKKIYKFKTEMNKKFLAVLKAHSILWVRKAINGGDLQLKTIKQIIKLKEDNEY